MMATNVAARVSRRSSRLRIAWDSVSICGLDGSGSGDRRHATYSSGGCAENPLGPYEGILRNF